MTSERRSARQDVALLIATPPLTRTPRQSATIDTSDGSSPSWLAGVVGALRAQLVHRRLPWLLGALGIVLALPSLWVGLQVDDHASRLTLFGGPSALDLTSGARLDAIHKLFLFVNGDPEDVRWGMDIGALPWWSSKNLTLNFWRPLSALTHWLDYRLFPDTAWLMHAHSLLWYALLLAVVTYHYRQLIGTCAASGLAAFMYAIDDARAFPVSWVCNRNAVITMVMGLASLALHVRWRRDGQRLGAMLAPLVFGAGLLAGEATMGALAYLAAYALVLDRGSLRSRALSLLPYFVLIVVWRVVYLKLGYRAYESGWYVDPGVEPLRFAGLVILRAPILLIGQWWTPPADATMLAEPSLVPLVATFSIPLLAFVGWMLWPVIRRSAEAKFWTVGMLLSLVPVCATQPMDRLLFFPSLGAFGLLGLFLVAFWQREPWLPLTRRWRAAAPWFTRGAVGAHMIAGLVIFPIRSYCLVPVWDSMRESMDALSDDAEIGNQDLIVLTAPNGFITGYMPVIRALDGRPTPKHIRWLAPCQQASEIHREDETTLRLDMPGGFPPEFSSLLSRDWSHPMATGERVELTGFSAEILGVGENGRPESVRFRFGEPLESARYRWLHWTKDGFARLTLPKVGQRMTMPSISWPF